jgi:hypothetical protein
MMTCATALLAQAMHGENANPFVQLVQLVPLVILVLCIAGYWKVFSKAGQPGWGVLIPIYNLYLITKVAGRPSWWLILMFIPLVGVAIYIITVVDTAQNFGQTTGFALGMIFLPFIFYPILGFGDARYCPVVRA